MITLAQTRALRNDPVWARERKLMTKPTPDAAELKAAELLPRDYYSLLRVAVAAALRNFKQQGWEEGIRGTLFADIYPELVDTLCALAKPDAPDCGQAEEIAEMIRDLKPIKEQS